VKQALAVVCLAAALAAAQLPAPAIPTPAPLPDGAARVVSLQGQVSLVRSGELWAIHINDLIRPRQEIVTGPDGHAILQVEDGSTFEVFPDSRVIFRANPGNWRDLLDVFLGKVKVQIQKLGGRPNPTRVSSPTALIAVRGTTFEVEVESPDATRVAVIEGLVEVRNQIRPGKVVELKGGESIRVLSTEPLAQAAPARMRTVARVLETVADRVMTVINQRGTTGPPAPGGGSAPGAGGTPGTGSSGNGTPPNPGGTGRPGDVPNGDTGPGVPKPPTTPTQPPTTTNPPTGGGRPGGN
jgi:hypothetical protein